MHHESGFSNSGAYNLANPVEKHSHKPAPVAN